MKDRLAIFLLIVMFGLIATVIYLFNLPGSGAPMAGVHPEFNTMLKSSSDPKTPGLIFAGYALGSLFILTLCSFVVLGQLKKGTLGKVKIPLLGLMALYLTIFLLLMTSYANYESGPDAVFFGGFPTPSAWMIYGMWGCPLLLILLFMFSFDSWFVTSEDMSRFQQLLEARDQGEDE